MKKIITLTEVLAVFGVDWEPDNGGFRLIDKFDVNLRKLEGQRFDTVEDILKFFDLYIYAYFLNGNIGGFSKKVQTCEDCLDFCEQKHLEKEVRLLKGIINPSLIEIK